MKINSHFVPKITTRVLSTSIASFALKRQYAFDKRKNFNN